VDARIAEISSLPAPTRTQKKELAALKSVAKTLAKPAKRLSQDFVELRSAAAAFAKLGSLLDPFEGDPYGSEVAAAVTRAGIALQERDDSIGDLRSLVGNPKNQRTIDAARARAATLRAAAGAAPDAVSRTRLLAKAEVSYTAALKTTEKIAKKTGFTLPPPRLRSGDVVGTSGARVAVPRGSGTSIDGASVLIPPGALAASQTITLAPATGFVGGRDVAAGGAVTVQPESAALAVPARVFLPFVVPSGANAADLVLFRDDAGTSTVLTDRTLHPDTTVSATSPSLGTFQPGIEAAPLGAPDGTYVVHMLASASNLGTTAGPPVTFDPSVSTGILVQSFTFLRSGAGTADAPSFSLVNRSFTPAAPHHLDVASPAFAGPAAVVWTKSATTGRFSLSFPLSATQTATAEGAASNDGNVIVFSGRGGTFDFVAVGLRRGTLVAPADLQGRWLAADLGVQLLDGGAEPFRTRWTSGARNFDAAASGTGASRTLTFDGLGTGFAADTTWSTNLASPTADVTTSLTGALPAETIAVGPDGALSGGAGRLRGQFAKDQGVLVLTTYDAATKSVRLLVAARQPASVPAATFVGTWNTVRFATGATAGVPDARTATRDFAGGAGTFTADAGGNANASFAPVSRAVYTLGAVPPIASMTWNLSQATAADVATSADFALVLDAAGNHRTGATWYGVSGDGNVLLGTLTAADARSSLGLVVGLR
jgi:hypothetical protein